ncbi:hypothetical protein QJS10_CPA03g01999 [Acorus calamus]|uniref:Uncharacterized protein n=1 Tax=Acorus calamus TaxID=4465 RepID=A0AAV9F6H9_ACOCL|nr:hypothetical protein QJS10_CPA03g01999 [Acorus calamus]
MKPNNQHHPKKDSKVEEKLLWEPMLATTPTTNHHHLLPRSPRSSVPAAFYKLVFWLLCLSSLFYAFLFLSSSSTSTSTHTSCPDITTSTTHIHLSNTTAPSPPPPPPPTGIKHIVFGIAASSRLWEKRKEYIKIWWRPGQMRGLVWLDSKPKKTRTSDLRSLPPIRISSDTSRFPYTNREGHRSAIRISRIVSETLRSEKDGEIRWFVMGDDDTAFVADNLVRVLSKYDHTQFYYIGSLSESHLQNIYFSYNMAYGGGGFAVSYPLAVALEKMQDRCIMRYPGLYGSDDRMQACMAELGVPLTRHPGFHQYDVYGDLFGLLAAHPVAPMVSLHHLDVVEPVLPNLTRAEGLKRVFEGPVRLDSAAVMQQSICYDNRRKWTVSVSWGFAVQVVRGTLSAREMEMPPRTFLNWYRRADYKAYAFNTRPFFRNVCQKPFLFYLSTAGMDGGSSNRTVTEYGRHVGQKQSHCRWKMSDPSDVDRVVVYKRPDPYMWDKSPRRNCCRVLPWNETTMSVDVGNARTVKSVKFIVSLLLFILTDYIA